MKLPHLSLPRGVPLLFMNSLLMSLGFYALIPYLSYYLTQQLLWSSFLAGLLLMVRQLSQQGPTFVTGMFADRLGYRKMLALGLVVRGIGFFLFSVFREPAGMFAAAVITGLGGALFEPTGNAALTALTPVPERGRVYAIKKIMANIGMVLAALLGALLIRYDFRLLSWICGGIFVFTGLVTYWRLPDIHVQIQPVPFREMFRGVIGDRHFVVFTAITAGFWYMYMQLFLTIPIQVVELTGNPQSVSLVYLLLSILIISAQYPVNRFIARMEITRAIRRGMILMGGGLVVLGTAHELFIFLAGFMIFAFGIMVVEPSIYELTARLAKPEMTASYFGFSFMALAVGGGASQGLGGLLMEMGEKMGFPALVWWVAGAVAVSSILGMLLLERSMRRLQSQAARIPV